MFFILRSIGKNIFLYCKGLIKKVLYDINLFRCVLWFFNFEKVVNVVFNFLLMLLKYIWKIKC